MKCVGQVENNKECHKVLRFHYPNVKRYGDIENVEPEKFKSVDVICGGFPCQDLSIAGKRKGLAGSRSGLFFEFARIVSFVKPKWFVLENVPGLLSSDEGRDFAIILRWLEKCGYLQAWRVFDSQYFGVAQRRRRVFIVGSLGNGSCAEILFESESLSRNPAEGRKAGKGTAGDVKNSTFDCRNFREDRGKSQPLQAKKQGWSLNFMPITVENPDITWALQERDCKGADSDTKEGHLIVFHTRQDPCSSDKAYALENSTPQANAICFQQIDGDDKAATPRGFGHGWQGQHNTTNAVCYDMRGHGDGKLANTLTGDHLNRPTDYTPCITSNMAVRRLTPRECERLQGFPDDWTRYGIDEDGKKVKISDTQRYKMCGNAVTVSVAEWIGKRIVDTAVEVV